MRQRKELQERYDYLMRLIEKHRGKPVPEQIKAEMKTLDWVMEK
jgi:hypothetical protein